MDPLKRVKSANSTTSKGSLEKATKTTTSLSQKGEYGFPSGHLGHLTQEQEDALEDFKKIITTEKLYTPATGDQPASHNDALLLRYLRARRFVPKDALEQFKDTEQWRKTNDLDGLYLNIDVEDYDESRRHYPQWLGRRDKRGIPVYLYRVGALDSKTMSAYTKNATDIKMAVPEGAAGEKKKKPTKDATPPRLLRLFALYENLAGFMTQLSSVLKDRPNPEVPITQSNNIVDIANVGLKQFWNLRGHMQDASVLATAHYPETLDRIFIVGAPSFFPTVWSWIKRWFDPITVSKIFILSEAQAYSTLSQFIDPENIPKQYGGKLEYQFGDIATVEPSYADRLTWKDDGASGIKNAKGELRRWPKGPVQWIERDDGDWDLLAVGSVGGKQRRDIIATLNVAGDKGGTADHSILTPRQCAKHTKTNGATTTIPIVGGTAVSQASEPAPPHDSVVAPVAVAAGATLVPVAVPGAAPTNANGHATSAATSEPLREEAKDGSSLPPALSVNEAIPPVPLAAVSQPLPGDTVGA